MRVIRRALENVRGDLQGLDAVHLESVSALLAGTRPNSERSLPGVWAARRYERLYLRRTAPAQSDSYVIPIPGPGVFSLPGEGFLRVEINASPAGENCRTAEFDALQIEFPLLVRNFAPGDRFRPFGMRGTRKLKDFFIDEKIDPERRRHIPLITEREILWIGGHRRCAGYVPKTGGGPVLRLSLLPEAPTIPL
jgi:tRNA(Ile)-lysidine synthase